MRYKLAIIVSGRPMFCEALKRLMGETQQVSEIVTSDEESASKLITKLKPDIVVIDRPDAAVEGLLYFSQQEARPTKVIVVGWNDNKLTTYARPITVPASVENLTKIIKGSHIN